MKAFGKVTFTILTLAVICLSAPAQGGTVQISGTISSDTTWTNSDTVVITATVTVSYPNRLIISPGTIVQFYPSTYLQIQKDLMAVGDSANPIVFTSRSDTIGGTPQAGDWGYVYAWHPSDAKVITMQVENCNFRYGTSGISLSDGLVDSTFIVRKVEVLNSVQYGIMTTSPTLIDSCYFANFGTSGIYVTGDGANSIISHCVINQNGSYLHTGNGIDAYNRLSLSVTNTNITDCRNGIQLRGTASNYVPMLILDSCNITNNDNIGIYFAAYSYADRTPYGSIHYCDIYGSSQNLYVADCIDTATVIDARYNWFGTEDGFEISGHVWDHNDDNGACFVDYSSFLDAPKESGQPVFGYLTARLSHDTTLTAAGGPYYLLGRYAINRGVRLEIEAGASFYAQPGTWLSVEGQIRANGDPSNRILFTSTADTVGGMPDGGDWYGVRLMSTADSAECLLSHCDIKYASNGVYIREVTAPYPAKISNCLITKTSSYGVSVYHSQPVIDSCEIVDFSNNGIYISNDGYSSDSIWISNTKIHQDTVTLTGQYYGISTYNDIHAVISGCEIYGCNYGINLWNYQSTFAPSLYLTESFIHDNANHGVVFNTSDQYDACPTGLIRNCQFENNPTHVYADACADNWTTVGVDARFNYWGTDDPWAITGKVFDFSDNQSAAPVDCSSPLDGPYPGGSPITNCVAGVIDADTVFTSTGSPYYVIGTPQLRRSRRMDIEPGVQFYFNGGTGLYVDGQLSAVGDSLNPIEFSSVLELTTTPWEGSWTGLHLESNSDSAESVIEWCEFRWPTYGIYLNDCSGPYPPTIRNCKVLDVSVNGIELRNSIAAFENVLIRNFGGNGIYQYLDISTKLSTAIRNCTVLQDTVTRFGVGNGMYFWGNTDPHITGCDVSGSGDGIEFYPSAYQPTFIIDSCNIHDITYQGIYVYAGSQSCPNGTVSFSNITNCGSHFLGTYRCIDSLTTLGIDARNNWWGTADPYIIGQRIKDHTDDSDHPPVNYSLWLDGPAPGGSPTGGVGYLSGVQATDTALGVVDSPYQVIGTWLIQNGVQVDVEPGVEFRFASGVRISTNGVFRAVGDSLNHIRFTSSSDTLGGTPQAGDWTGIGFYDGSDAEPCSLVYCDFQYATTPIDQYENRWPWPLQILNCDFRDLSYSGLYFKNSSGVIESCIIEDVGSYGIYVTGTESLPSIRKTVIDQDSSIHVGIHGWGIYVLDAGRVDVSGCKITDFVYGVGLRNSDGGVAPGCHIVNSEISDNATYGIYLYGGTSYPSPTGTINFCNLTNNPSGAIVAYSSSTSSLVIDAKYNWWGSTDSATITNNYIWDHYDNPSYSPYVDFMPVAQSANKMPCPSDFDFTGRTDYDDLAMLGYAFGALRGEDNWLEVCNISQASISASRIDGFDLAFFGSQYGNEGGCYPFSKAVDHLDLGDAELIVPLENRTDGWHMFFDPRIGEGYNIIGLILDVVVDTADIALPQDRSITSDKYIELSRTAGDRLIYSVMSLDGGPIDEFIRSVTIDLLSDTMISSSSVTVENAAIIVDDYRFVEVEPVLRSEPVMPYDFRLRQNYPNPFNPSTTIQYSLPIAADVSLVIYNVLGQIVNSFSYAAQPPGDHTITWDGCDKEGRRLSTGVYFYKLQAGDFEDTRKMMLLK